MHDLDRIIGRHHQLRDRLARMLRSLFDPSDYALGGPEGLFSKVATPDVSRYFGFSVISSVDGERLIQVDSPYTRNVLVPSLRQRVGWYLQRILDLGKEPAFIPFDQDLHSIQDLHLTAEDAKRVKPTLLDLVLDRSIQRNLEEAALNFRMPNPWLEYQDPFKRWTDFVKKPGPQHRNAVFDEPITVFCRFVLPKLDELFSKSKTDPESVANFKKLLGACTQLAGIIPDAETERTKDKWVKYDLLSSLTFAAAEMKKCLGRSTSGRDCRDIRRVICRYTEILFKKGGLLDQLYPSDPEKALTGTNSVPPLLNGAYRPSKDYETMFVADLIDEDFVKLHILLNSCSLIHDHARHCIGNKCGIAHKTNDNLELLTRCVAKHIQEPLPNDLFRISLSLRILNCFARDLLSDAANAAIGHALDDFLNNRFNGELKEALRKMRLDETKYNDFIWPNETQADKNFRKSVSDLRQHIEAIRSEEKGIGDPSKPKPLNILIAAPPGSGKSVLVSKIVGYKPIELNCTQYGTVADLMSEIAERVKGQRGKTGREIGIFLDEIDALDSKGVYAALLPLMWDRQPTRNFSIPQGVRLLLFFAGSKYSTCREYRLELMTKWKEDKGPDFVSRIMAEIDLPGVAGASQYAARITTAANNLHQRELDDSSKFEDGSLEKILRRAALNLSLTTGRGIDKWMAQYKIKNHKLVLNEELKSR